MKIIKAILGLFFIVFLQAASCTKEPVNPYDQNNNPEEVDPEIEVLDPTSIAGLHTNIFGKTCANSGCHDGTFEPDFRTIESTYNTLVYHPIIKNDLQGTYQYRVLPNQDNQSQLIARLTFDIDGNSGVMPLALEPDSDWTEKKDEYIQNVKDWIKNGAKDVFGNSPSLPNALPQMQGVAGQAGDWLNREDAGQGALEVKQSRTELELYIALSDDSTSPTSLKENKIRFALSADGFEDMEDKVMELLSTPIERPGYEGEAVKYYHKITINPKDLASLGETIFFRVYTKDDTNPLTEIPSNGGANYIKRYFSFKVVQ